MNINQILNSALLNESKESLSEMGPVDSYTAEIPTKKATKDMTPATRKALDALNTADKKASWEARTGGGDSSTNKTAEQSSWEKRTGGGEDVLNQGKNIDWKQAGKYGGAAAIGLGAGIGALALAKKLRAKKAAAKAKKA